VSIEEVSKFYNIIGLLEVNVSSRIRGMLLAENALLLLLQI
jgi:hypothetical protein